jgi:hypothetical protein
MPHTQAQVFIKTLTELRDDERALKKARLRMQLKAHLERFAQGFRSDFADSRQTPDWSPRSNMAAQKPERQAWHD